MKSSVLLIMIFAVMASCTNDSGEESIDLANYEKKDTLSQADVDKLLKSNSSSGTNYQGVVTYDLPKEYFFSSKDSTNIDVTLVSEQENLRLKIYKEVTSNSRIDTAKVIKVKNYKPISDKKHFTSFDKHSSKYKAVVSLPKSKSKDSIGNFTLTIKNK